MNPFHLLRDWFSPGRKLRNKPGGLAFIRLPQDCDYGVEALNGRIVQTLRVLDSGRWEIEPHQPHVMTSAVVFVGDSRINWPGDQMVVIGVPDECLIPIENPGDEAADESVRWLPPVPTSAPVAPAKKERIDA